MRGIEWCFQIFDILKNRFFKYFCHILGEYNSQSHFSKKRLKSGKKMLRHYFFQTFWQLLLVSENDFGKKDLITKPRSKKTHDIVYYIKVWVKKDPRCSAKGVKINVRVRLI